MAAERKADPAAPIAPPSPPEAPVPFDGAADNSGGPPPPIVPAPATPGQGTITVALGISVSCRRGIADAGEVVSAKDFGDGAEGEAALAALVARGALIRS